MPACANLHLCAYVCVKGGRKEVAGDGRGRERGKEDERQRDRKGGQGAHIAKHNKRQSACV